MKRFFIYVLITMLMSVVMVGALTISILVYPENVFKDSYQSVIQRKYDALVNCDESKIIIVGGSSAGFGVDEEMLEEATGYKVVNLGLHAGFGSAFPTQLSKANINEGDIVLLAYEWGWHSEGSFDTFGTDLVVSGIDHRLDMYRWLNFEQTQKVLGYAFTFANKKSNGESSEGVYSASSFDDKGRMILDRPNCIMKYEGNEKKYRYVEVTDSGISEDVAEYLIGYRDFVHKQNAKVYFISPCYYKGSLKSDMEALEKVARSAYEQLGIEYISNPTDYAFPIDYMFDTIYHCNNEGEGYRTGLIINDLKKVNVGL